MRQPQIDHVRECERAAANRDERGVQSERAFRIEHPSTDPQERKSYAGEI